MTQPPDPINPDESRAVEEFDPLAPEQDEESTRRPVEELTLAQLLQSFWRNPRQTSSAFVNVLNSDHTSPHLIEIEGEIGRKPAQMSASKLKDRLLAYLLGSRIAGYSLAFMLILSGNMILAADIDTRRSEDVQLAAGFPFLVLGVIVWFLTELFFYRDDLRAWWQSRRTSDTPADEADEFRKNESFEYRIPWYDEIPLWRFGLALVSVVLSTFTFLFTGNNTFNTPTFYLWLLSIAGWAVVFAPLDFNPANWASKQRERLQNVEWQSYWWVILCLTVIIGVGIYFRFYQLDSHPLEMTDDHVEKILDAGRVRDGDRNIFFANNGGREPLQMYLIALVSHLPGFGINHDTIKFVSAVESLLTIPVLFWMGYAIFEGESQRRRILIGLLVAALVAVSYWHVAITRQGLRIPLTPLVVALQLIYLFRCLRHNRRSDFVIAGLILGFGLYTYQAVRMLPIVVIVAGLVALIFNAKTMRDRIQYVLNFSVLVAISFAVFVPMFRYSVDEPEQFWRRTTGRLLGDDLIQDINEFGEVTYRAATIQERVEAFGANVPQLVENIRNVFLMFNWEGDVATISGVSLRPAMDVWSASLLIAGIAAWLVFAIRKRQSIYWMVPLVAFLMLLPSALSIAAPHENPSHTRTSGAIPAIYLITSLPLALVVEMLLDNIGRWRGIVLSGFLCFGLIGSSFSANNYLYFEVYPERYQQSFNPYSGPGRYLYGYVLTGGSYGNAFLIGYEHWWSHRAIGLEGGLEEFWPGGIYPYVAGEYSIQPIVDAIHTNVNTTGIFKFRPSSGLLFFISPDDVDTLNALQELFPDGVATERQTYNPNEPFTVYEVPPFSEDGLDDWLQEYPAS